MKELRDIIEQHLKLKGFENTLRADELRKFVWEHSDSGVTYTILLNYPMTVMNIEITQT